MMKRILIPALVMLSVFSCDKKPVDPVDEPAYKVADLYNENGITGVIYKVTDDGNHGMIVSLNYAATKQWCIEEALNGDVIGCFNENNGLNNMNTVKQQPDWEVNFPAFKWCDDLNTDGISGWYLPAINELAELYSVRTKVNAALTENGGAPMSIGSLWWSSTEYSDWTAWVKDFSMGEQGDIYKAAEYCYTRAVHAF